jgi:hypothetical protein
MEVAIMSEYIHINDNLISLNALQYYRTRDRLKDTSIENKSKITYLNHCPEKDCSQYYVDTLVGYYYFVCIDKRHSKPSQGGNN